VTNGKVQWILSLCYQRLTFLCPLRRAGNDVELILKMFDVLKERLNGYRQKGFYIFRILALRSHQS
jgi:hypothetical protein